jgi:hypothetical protein
MIRWEAPQKNLENLFGRLSQWALLRNADVYENFARGGDCDLLTGNLDEASRVLVEELGPPILIAHRSYLRSFFYPWGHLDLTNHYYWRGIQLMDGHSILAKKKCSGPYPHVSSVDSSIIKLLGNLLWGGFIKERYTRDILTSYRGDPEYFSSRLNQMLGEEAAGSICSDLSNENWEGLVKKVSFIRKSVKKHYRKNSFIRYWAGQFRFTLAEVRLRIFDLLPMLILNVSREDRQALDAEWPIVNEVVDQHCKVVNLRSGFSHLVLPLILLRNISYRARNGLLVIVRESQSKGAKNAGVFYVNCFVNEYSSDLGLKVVLDQYYTYCVSRNQKNARMKK